MKTFVQFLGKIHTKNGFFFLGSDRSVMNRTQRARYHRDNKRPAQIMCYAQFSSLISALLTIFIGIFFGLLAKYKPGRYLLEKYPRFFSMGMVSKQGPTKRMAENTNFEMKIFGRGKMKNIYLKH